MFPFSLSDKFSKSRSRFLEPNTNQVTCKKMQRCKDILSKTSWACAETSESTDMNERKVTLEAPAEQTRATLLGFVHNHACFIYIVCFSAVRAIKKRAGVFLQIAPIGFCKWGVGSTRYIRFSHTQAVCHYYIW
jgi:hypothetical protein